MQRFITQENIHRYDALLKGEIAPEQRTLLESLLEEERSKLGALDVLGPDSHPGEPHSNNPAPGELDSQA
jgi:hypothetical protein